MSTSPDAALVGVEPDSGSATRSDTDPTNSANIGLVLMSRSPCRERKEEVCLPRSPMFALNARVRKAFFTFLADFLTMARAASLHLQRQIFIDEAPTPGRHSTQTFDVRSW